MASVYYLFENAFQLDQELISLYIKVGNLKYLRVLAAIKIQKVIRGFLTRKWFDKQLAAITTVQRFIRGWDLRFHLAETLPSHYDNLNLRYYNTCATKLQALYKGYMTRKIVNVKKMVNKNEEVAKINKETQEVFSKKLQAINDLHSLENQEVYINFIVETLFHRHHLLRTTLVKGVLSEKDSEEYSIIEKMLKSISWKEFILKQRRLYKKCYSKQEIVSSNYTTRELRKLEKLKRESKYLADQPRICQAKKPTYNSKEFYSKPLPSKHPKSIFASEKWKRPEVGLRVTDKSKNISDKDFVLSSLVRTMQDNEIPPYYIEFWFGKECPLHNILE